MHSGWEMECGDWRTIPDQELLLTLGRELRGWEEGNPHGECP